MIERLSFNHERNLTIDDLISRLQTYYPDADINILKKAYKFAEKSHEGQKRSSGEKYIIHPLNVSAILIKLRLDLDSIISGLLHDVVEDCGVSPETIESEFSPSIAQIVIGLTKISKIHYKTREEKEAENFRKMIVAMAQDIRVIIVKLADRMHNMRTLQYVSPIKQKAIAKETLEIYVPLSNRLGIHSVKAELEDLCLRYLKAETYYALAEKVAMKKSEREEYIKKNVELINNKLSEYNVKAEVKGRPKHFYSIYKKMTSRGVPFEEVQDILAFRIITNNITECYKTLGIIHSSFTPIPGRFKDYIAIPKKNNYQSLHTTVIGPNAERIEIQIRTLEMHNIAETGIAAHWKYKEGISSTVMDYSWVEDLLEINQNVENNSEFLDVVKSDLNISSVFVFTPNGDVKELKAGSTPLDFAYAIHTEVGNRCVGSKVNGKMVPLKFTLKSGDVAQILTSKTQTPSKDWLNIVKTSRAKSKIKQWLLKKEKEKNTVLGEDILEKTLKLYSLSIKVIKKSGTLTNLLKNYNFKTNEELFAHIGIGKVKVKELVELIPEIDKSEVETETEKVKKAASFFHRVSELAKKTSKKGNAVIVDDQDDVLVRMAKCCNPIPGDPIIGFITRGRGITVHTEACKKRQQSEFTNLVKVNWNPSYEFNHPVNIKVITRDRPGILAQISNKINNAGINIRSAMAKSLPGQKGSFIFEVEVKDYSDLLKTITIIESMKDVMSVMRA